MGFFSWKTADTQESIPNRYSTQFDPARPVYLLQPGGKQPIEEANYEGYGTFGGVNALAWLAEHNLDTAGLDDKLKNELGIIIDCTNYYTDKSGKAWFCGMHVSSTVQSYFSALNNAQRFSRYDALIANEGKTVNDLILSGEWTAHQLMNNIEYPLKFSHDPDAVYEDLPASATCEHQGYFYPADECLSL